jgi:transcriptional regulator GlxA family with amidase domain
MAGKPKSADPAEIALLLYPGAQLAAIHGLTDLFQVANRLAMARTGAGQPLLRVSHWQPADDGHDINCVYSTLPGLPHRPMIIVLPPSLNGTPTPEMTQRLAGWLKGQHKAGAILGSICAGAFLLAETGLLDGRTATTHWNLAEALQARFPAIKVDGDKLIIDDGDVITAGGLMAWTDLGLKLVDRLLGPTVMIETARFLLVDPPGREQRFYSSFSPKLHHGDAAILKVQHWLQAEGARDVTLTLMAQRAGLGDRTFLRRFVKATGLKPTEYCQTLRIGKARERLEFSSQTVEQIAWEVGYDDPGAFRKVFGKVMGLTPGDYRRRFSVGAAARSLPRE